MVSPTEATDAIGKADLSGRARKPAMFDIKEAKASGIGLSGKFKN